ncbi:MAG: hypothetical protein O3B01_28070 [Planctomycetota bacterium]|nr:hypothetical protein [Planctomycetota bacterium]
MIFNIPDVPSLRNRLHEYTKANPYQKLTACRSLIDRLGDKRKIDALNYVNSAADHDLAYVPGRTAWAIEILLGINLSKVTTNSSQNELDTVRKQAQQYLKAFESAMLSMETIYRIGFKESSMLSKKYGGRIVTGVSEKADESAQAMKALLDTWFPLGKKLSDLEKIIGRSPDWKSGKACFRFDNGQDGIEFQFTVDEGVITAVSVLDF